MMRHSEKPAGKTVAEALGIEVSASAPGGKRIAMTEGDQRSTRNVHLGAALDYDGFADVDGFGRND